MNNNANSAMFLNACKSRPTSSPDEIISSPEAEGNGLNSSIAAITTGAFGLGSVLGPLLSSLLVTFLSYGWTYLVLGMLVFACSFIQLHSQFWFIPV